MVRVDRFADTPPPVLTATCEVCGQPVTLDGRGWVHDSTGEALSGQHLAWPKQGTRREAEVARCAPGGCVAAFW